MSANLNLEAQDGKLEVSSQHKRKQKPLPTRIDEGDVPKSEFFQEHNCWCDEDAITTHYTKSKISERNLDNYLKTLREYLHENVERRWPGMRNYMEFDIIIRISYKKGNYCDLHSSVEIIEKLDDFVTAFDRLATEIKDKYKGMESNKHRIIGDIGHCVLHEYWEP